MIITLICKVVDNFGDIGVVFRLANRLNLLLSKSKSQNNKINLIVDDLQSFKKICNKVDLYSASQNINGINVFHMNNYDFCHEYFSKNDGKELGTVVECFQCGRPDWMEKILFEEKLNRTVHTIMLDYLTAEDYAQDFHCLKSLTRSAKVTKVNFMPGFTEKTGGLTIDDEWETLQKRNKNGPVLIFTYERDWTGLAQALSSFNKKVLLAQGRGKESFELCARQLCDLQVLDFMDQYQWDKMMKSCSVLFIRGEESMSRACLSGIPFVWHAYPQSDEYQLVKVKALLSRMKEYFNQQQFSIIEKVWIDFNSDEAQLPSCVLKNDVEAFLNAADDLEDGFNMFAKDLRKNGDLGANLMTFIEKIDIMN